MTGANVRNTPDKLRRPKLKNGQTLPNGRSSVWCMSGFTQIDKVTVDKYLKIGELKSGSKSSTSEILLQADQTVCAHL